MAKNRPMDSLGEDFKISVQNSLRNFVASHDEEFSFPKELTADQRHFVHRVAPDFGLRTKSYGKKNVDRILSVYKTREEQSRLFARLEISKKSQKILDDFAASRPPEPAKIGEKPARNYRQNVQTSAGNLGRVRPAIPGKFLPGIEAGIREHQEKLPVKAFEPEILAAIGSSRVTIITGETGSGKTTQIPQYLLKNSGKTGTPVRIICTEPRRLAAVAMATRVARETNTLLGSLVGYKVRLDSQVSSDTLLTYCTNGVLLGQLTSTSSDMLEQSVTHIIVDEIHERDRFSDFLLTVLKQTIHKSPNLRLVLMSATANVQLFSNYFGSAQHISVPGRLYPVTEFYLGDILMRLKNKQVHKQGEGKEPIPAGNNVDDIDDAVLVESPAPEIMDSAISDAFVHNKFDSLIEVFLRSTGPVSYQHSNTGVAPLMAAAVHGRVDIVKELMGSEGIDLTLEADNGWNVYNFAVHGAQEEVIECLNESQPALVPEKESMVPASDVPDDEEIEVAVKEYLSHTNDEYVDYDLVAKVIEHVDAALGETGAILVFLPGFDDIAVVQARLSQCNNLQIYPLHGQLLPQDQAKVFTWPAGMRKVVLSTNIAETSLTIDDVVCVVDSGKAKEVCYDSLGGTSTLKVSWISQNSAAQRKGRAGRTRPGFVFRMYSKSRFANMEEQMTPEVLRTPLTDLCLQTKVLAPPNMSISDFMSELPEPPSSIAVREAIADLRAMEALTSGEDLTVLGKHLVGLSIEPHLGKMLVYAVFLKCLDPVLTIVSCLSYRDLFSLSTNAGQKNVVKENRRWLANGVPSDHMVLLKAFEGWRNQKNFYMSKRFCQDHGLSSVTLQMVQGIRKQLFDQIRSRGFQINAKEVNLNSTNWSVVKAAILAGAYPRLASVFGCSQKLQTLSDKKVKMHASSLVACPSKWQQSLKTAWCTYDEMTKPGHQTMIKGVTLVNSASVALVAGPTRLDQPPFGALQGCSSVQSRLGITEWLQFEGKPGAVGGISMLRVHLSDLFNRMVHCPSNKLNQFDRHVIQLFANIVANEDRALKL